MPNRKEFWNGTEIIRKISSGDKRVAMETIRWLVAEAERRGQVKAWGEAKNIAESFRKEPQPVGMGECAFCGAWFDECHCNPDAISIAELVEAIEAKLTELKSL